jgi:hypothetical protein
MPRRPIETSLSHQRPSRFWAAQKPRNKFAVSFDPLKRRFLDFTQVAFSDTQKTDNEFSGPFDTLNHRILDFILVAIMDDQKS